MYAIVCVPTGERYIGASAELRVRRRQHASDLRAGKHPHTGLQTVYDLHGYGNFLWLVLEEFASADLLPDAELRWMADEESRQPGSLLNDPNRAYRGKDSGHVPGLALKLQVSRAAAGLSQVQAGEKAGVHHVSIAKFETEKATPTLRVLYLLAAAYGVEVCELLPPAPKKKGK